MLSVIERLLHLNRSTSVRTKGGGRYLLCEETPVFAEERKALVFEHSKFSPDTLAHEHDYQEVWLFFTNTEELASAEATGLDARLDAFKRHITKQENRDIKIKKICFMEFRNRIMNIETIKKFYTEQYRDWNESEGGDFYVPPKAVSETKRITRNLHDLVSDYMNDQSNGGGIVYLFGDYGDGKTSFCRYFLNNISEDLYQMPVIPILFNLNDHASGSIGQFIESQLNTRYNLPFSLEDFIFLTNKGLFAIFLDAFDQMFAVPTKREIDAGFQEIRAFALNRGRVFLTSRDDFYRRYVQPLEHERDRRVLDSIWLSGFDESELKQYAEKRGELERVRNKNKFMEFITENRGKPLLVKTITDNIGAFLRLMEEKDKVTPFEVFNMPYQAWLKIKTHVLKDRQTRNYALRCLVWYIIMHGINRGCSFDDWLEVFSRPPNDPIDEKNIQVLREDLATLRLLDRIKIEKHNLLVFASPPYLEFLLAKFVLEELDSSKKYAVSLIREVCLTPLARKMIVGQLYYSDHGIKLKELIEGSSYKSFADVQYQASNSFSIILHAVRAGIDGPWKNLLSETEFRKTVLRDADCEGADLTGLLLTSADLTGCDFSYSTLVNTNMEFSLLEGTRFNEHGELLTSSIFYSDKEKNHFIVGGTRNGSVIVLSIGHKRIKGRFQPHQDEITALRVNKSNTKIFTGSKDGFISVFNLDDGTDQRSYNPIVRGVCAFSLSQDEKAVVAGGRSGEAVKFLFSQSNKITRYTLGLPPNPPWLTAMDITYDERNILVGHADGTLRIIRDWTRPEYFVEESPQRVRGVAGICILNDHYALVNDSVAVAYLLSLGDLTLRPLSKTLGARCIAYAVETKEVFLLSKNIIRFGTLEQIADDPSRLQEFRCIENANTLAVSPDGQFVAVGGSKLQLMDRKKYFKPVIEEEMHLNCRGMNVNHTIGLDAERLAFLLRRGSLIPPDTFLNKFIEVGKADINAAKRTFKCAGCQEKKSFSEEFHIVGRSLYCFKCRGDSYGSSE